MQPDNAPNLTAEVANQFMKASQVTKVISTAGHPQTQGLVERQKRTLLTLSRVFCCRRIRDWDQHLDEVMGAYNSTRHANTSFSPYMLTRGTKKAIPLTYTFIQNLPLNRLNFMQPTWNIFLLDNKKSMIYRGETHIKLNNVKNSS